MCRTGFFALAGCKVVMPPILSMAIKEYNGEVDAKSATIWARDSVRAKAAEQDLPTDLGFLVLATHDLAGAVLTADIVVTTTPSADPLINAEWLRPRHHITAMGSNQHHKSELNSVCLTRADLYLPDRQGQTATLGELRAAIAVGLFPAD
jgi:ornithine cyclodeaminase